MNRGTNMKISLFTSLPFIFVFLGRASGSPFSLHGTYGVFTSNHFPAYYENNLNQTWTITVSKGFHVILYFTYFDLEDSSSEIPCDQDYLEIFDGIIWTNASMGRFCGNPQLYPREAPALFTRQFQSTDNVMLIRFVSDYSNELADVPSPTGFQAQYMAEDRDECEELDYEYERSETPETVGKCSQFCNNFLGGYKCSCGDGYRLHENGYTCVGQCDGIQISSSSGVITSPGYPSGYPKLTDCDWTIETAVGQVIEVNFVEKFGIETHDSGTCPYDWVQIGDDKMSRKFCGETIQTAPIVSTGNAVRIEFHSDMITELAGFKLAYRSRGVFCDLPQPPEHGRIVETYGADRGNLPYDSVVVFECEVGYDMIGVHKISCLKDGSFDDKVPQCVRK